MKAPTVTSPLEQITHLAAHHSSLLAVFDTAKLAGFPLPSPALASYESANVWDLQSRPGAGSSLAGFIRSADKHLAKPTTALISTPTLPLLLPALHELPEETTKGNRLVIHLAVSLPPTDRPLDAPSASLAQVTPLLPLLPESFAVVFSATPEDIIRNTHAIYEDSAFTGSNVLHVVEGVFAGRELVKRENAASSILETFHYHGPADATKVVVLPASYSSSLLRSVTLPTTGVLTINVLGPWPTESLMDALPHAGKNVEELIVVEEHTGQDATEVVKEMVIGAVFGQAGTSGGKIPKITGVVVKGGETSLAALSSSIGVPFQLPSKAVEAKQSVFLTSTESLLPHLLTKTFLSSPSLKTRLSTLTSTTSTLNQSTLRIAPAGVPVETRAPFTSYPASGSSSLIFVSTASALTQTRSAFDSLAPNGSVLISLPGWDKTSVAENLSPKDRKTLAAKNARIFVLPPSSKAVAEAEETALGLVGFFLLYAGIGQGGKLPDSVRAVVEAALGHLAEFIPRAEEDLTEVNVATLTTTTEEDEEEEKRAELTLDALPSFPSVAPSSSAASADTTKPFQATWHAPALHLLFKESFAPNASKPSESLKAHQPSLHEETYLATVTENRRLTPTTYDRNVFHLELSTAGTGLKYDVGEALGVHGWNDEQETRDFLAWYGVSPSTVLSIPLANGKIETRTALQMFQQRVDIFGRPGKSFYAALVGKTKDREEARQLRFISAPEGAPMFKKWSENETVTFADVLQRFPGVKENVSIAELVNLVGEIHPRHYSISSAQKFVGDAVHLLVVTVEWDSTLGKPRFGQCTRYLANLKVGEKVTVSIKPSVMKLPPLDTQPVIMAGLGTGAAPFRAFIQHRAWQKSQGIEVGPLVYYFGARNSSQEYLYGEEIEAYLRGGILTHAGLAFSRDTAKKVYIQHKMLEDGPLLSGMLTAEKEEDKAYFYLCGPTWPVPDVYAALVGSLVQNQGQQKDQAEAYIEELKEAERYVLEVY